MKLIPLGTSRFARIDDDLHDRLVSLGPWSFDGRYAVKPRHRMPKLYLHAVVCELAGIAGAGDIDHEDRDRLNNQRANLSYKTRSGNMHNRGATVNSLTGVKGVVWDARRETWLATMRHQGVQKFLGYFSHLEDAINARMRAEIAILGKPKLRAIFIDLDDTLNCLSMPALKHVGCDLQEFPTPGSYDIVGAANQFLESPLTIAEFWDKFDRQFWLGLPKSPEFNLILEAAEAAVGLDNLCILTTPTLDPECAAAKVEWIYCNLPTRLHRQFFIGPRKSFCAHHQHLLIDDSDGNVNGFRKRGGHAILVPRPWNSNHRYETGEYLTARFEEMFSCADCSDQNSRQTV